MNTTKSHEDSPLAGVADELAHDLAGECATCTGLICLDCAQGLAHDRCTRPCADCAGEDVDWDAAWETQRLVTELGGLARLDEAIRRL